MALLEWLVAQWPLAVGGAIVVMAIAGWVERVKRVQELELKVRQLQRDETDRERRIVAPTKEEVERYGRGTQALARDILRRPDLFLGLIAILGPIVAGIYQLYVTTQRESRVEAQIARIQSEIDVTDRQIAAVTEHLNDATTEALRELSGHGETKIIGEGPVYRELLSRRDELAVQLDELQRRKTILRTSRTTLEQERRTVRPIIMHPDGQR